MYYLSSPEGLRFAEIANEMTERIGLLGPNPLALPLNTLLNEKKSSFIPQNVYHPQTRPMKA
jgi:hypothetical protein